MARAGAPARLRHALIAALTLLMLAPAQAQTADPRAMIRLRVEGQPSPPATLADIAWLEGSWIGDMPEGPVEHVTLSPRFGTSRASFAR